MSLEKKRYPKPNNFEPEKAFPDDHPRWPGKPRCQSWNPNQGRQCGQLAMKGKIRCGSHGGKTPSGEASPHFKHGKYSKDLKGDLLQRYEAGMDDTEWLSLRSEIALIDARLGQLVAGIGSSKDSSAAWAQAGKVAEDIGQKLLDYKRATVARDGPAMGNAIFEIEALTADMDKLIQIGLGDVSIWQEIYTLTERRRKLVESESKRRVELRQAIAVESALGHFVMLIDEMRQAALALCDKETARLLIQRVYSRADSILIKNVRVQ